MKRSASRSDPLQAPAPLRVRLAVGLIRCYQSCLSPPAVTLTLQKLTILSQFLLIDFHTQLRLQKCLQKIYLNFLIIS